MTRTTLAVRTSTLFLLAALAASPGSALSPWCENGFPPCDTDAPASPCFRPKPPDERCDCDKCKKSPCYVATGVYEGAAADLELPTPGLPLVASRSYHSSQMIDGPTGIGWSSNLTARIHATTYFFAPPSTYLTEAIVTMPEGKRLRFSDNGDGTFAPPLGRYDRLARNPDGTWDLTLERSSTVLHFGPGGELLSVTDEYGNAHVYTYDAGGRLERVADAAGSGRYIAVFWGADGRIALLQDSAGRTVQYTYDARGVMTAATNPLGQSTFYTYADGRYVPLLAAVRDHWNRVVTEVVYDAADRTRSYTEHGELWTYTYNYQNNRWKTSKADSAGNTWVFTHGVSGLVTLSVPPAEAGAGPSSVTYYGDGAVREETDEVGVRTYHTFDEQGRLTSVTRDYLGSQAVRYDYSYDPSFPDKVTAMTPRNPGTGQVDTVWQGWRYDYYQEGSPAPGALHHVYRVRVDGGLDVMATYTYDDKGRVLSAIDATGATTDYSYDGVGNLVTVTGPANNDQGIRPVTTYEHDALARVTATIDPMGSRTTYTYDALGRLLTVTLPKPAAGSPLDFTTTYSYDNFDPVLGLLFTDVTDPNGNVARQGHDQFGRLVQSIDHLGAVTRHGYAGADLATITDANDNVTTYTYDRLHRLASTVFPDGAVETYTYRADGLLASKTDRKAQTISYTYDAHKRLTTKQFPDATSVAYTYAGERITQVVDTSTSPSETHTFAYDGSYRTTSETQGPRGTIDYTYTPGDQVASYTVAGGGPTASYTYYPDGALRTIAWTPVAGLFEYRYNLRGQDVQVLFPSGQSREYLYDEQGRVLQLANRHPGVGNLATFTYAYDHNHANGQPTMLGQRTSMWDDRSSQGLGGGETRYYYDLAYQLTRGQYPSGPPPDGGVHDWTYDDIGNRLSSAVNGVASTYIYFQNAAGKNFERLQSDGSRSYAYDANGNTTSIVGGGVNLGFTYDLEDRLSGTWGTATAEISRDYRGRLVHSSTTGQVGSLLHAGSDLLAYLGATRSDFLAGRTKDDYLAVSQDGAVRFHAIDALKSVVHVTDAAGTILGEHHYDAWGILSDELPGTPAVPFYTGRPRDSAGGYDYRARYYWPSAGRFLQEDPLRSPGGRINSLGDSRRGSFLSHLAPDPSFLEPRYALVLNNPISHTDTHGLAVRVCSRKTDWGFGNHAYFWDDRPGLPPDQKFCGIGPSTKETGPALDACNYIPGSDGNEDKIMTCCRHQKAEWVYIPFFHDCQTGVKHALRCAKLTHPGVPGDRFGPPCDLCEIAPPPPTPPPLLGYPK